MKIGFFRRMFLSVTDFRLYPIVVKERTLRAIGYFLKLIIVCSLLLSIYYMTLIDDFINQDLPEYQMILPDFEIKNGELIFGAEKTLDINNLFTLIMKNDYLSNFSFDELSEERLYIVACKDKILLGNSRDNQMSTPLEIKDLPDLTKEEVFSKTVQMYSDNFVKAYIFIILFFGTFTYFFINKAWMLLLYMFVLMIFDGLFTLKLKIKDYLKLAIYISTLPIALQVFAISIGGVYSTTAEFITFIISGIYAFYALRAIRLDLVLTGVAGNTVEEKISNAIKKAQNDLEKELENIEKQAEEEDKKENKEEENKEEENKEEENKEEENNKQEDKGESNEENK